RQIASSTRSDFTEISYYFLSHPSLISFLAILIVHTTLKGIKMTVHGIQEGSIVNLREKDGEWLVVQTIKNDDLTYQLRNTDTNEEVNVALQDIISPNK
ncbi:TPA: hypothetical protein ACHOQP_005691, partial [Escherichia coli]